MYRECLLGLALSATLSELSETHELTEQQKTSLWAVFDRVMDNCLSEVPPTTRVIVRTPLDYSHYLSNRNKLSNTDTDTITPISSTHLITEEREEYNINTTENYKDIESDRNVSKITDSSSNAEEVNNDDNAVNKRNVLMTSHATVTDATLPFPVYRCVDGLWTILLKDPEISVRDEFGVEESIRLDYLKIYLKDVSRQNELTAKQKRALAAPKKKKRQRRSAYEGFS